MGERQWPRQGLSCSSLYLIAPPLGYPLSLKGSCVLCLLLFSSSWVRVLASACTTAGCHFLINPRLEVALPSGWNFVAYMLLNPQAGSVTIYFAPLLPCEWTQPEVNGRFEPGLQLWSHVISSETGCQEQSLSTSPNGTGCSVAGVGFP